MKIPTLLAILASLFACIGCATTGTQVNTVNVEQDAERLARDISLFAEILLDEEDRSEAAAYLRLTSDALGLVLQTDDYSATAVIRHMNAIGVPELQSQEAKLAAVAVSILYERMLSRYEDASVPKESGARVLLSAAKTAIDTFLDSGNANHPSETAARARPGPGNPV